MDFTYVGIYFNGGAQMTKLDTLLLELERLDGERTPGEWNDGGHLIYTGIESDSDPSGWVVAPEEQYETVKTNDAAFIVKAVNSNRVLREVIKIQRDALAHECYCTPDYTGIVCVCGPCQALEAAEKVCEEEK